MTQDKQKNADSWKLEKLYCVKFDARHTKKYRLLKLRLTLLCKIWHETYKKIADAWDWDQLYCIKFDKTNKKIAEALDWD